MKKILTIIGLAAASLAGVNAQILITQYYEGSAGTNKWIELTNVSGSTVDFSLTSFQAQLWSNANTEAYKTNGTPSATFNLTTGTLGSGFSLVLGNSAATPTPTYMTVGTFTQANTVANFNGDDSVTITSGTGAFATANLVDAIGFTDAGAEGTDTSFTRLNTGVGFNLTAGSKVTDFAAVWSNIGLAAANSAAVSTDPRIGYSAVPEPKTWVLIGIGTSFMLWNLRRRRRVQG